MTEIESGANRLFLLFALLYVIGGALALLLSMIFGLNKEHFGVAFLAGGLAPPIILRGISKRESTLKRAGMELNEIRSRAPEIGFISFLACIIVVMLEYDNWSRDYYLHIWFFAVVALAASIIIFQVWSLSREGSRGVALIIVEIVILAVTISASFEFLFATPYGNDATYHIAFINWMGGGGTASGYPGQYENHPLYHIAFLNLSCVLDSSVMETLLWMSLIQIGFGVFLFLMVRRFAGDKIALISLLVVLLAPNFLVSRYSFYPGGFSVIFLMVMLYLVTKKDLLRYPSGMFLFYTFAFVAILFHPLLPIFILTSLLFVYLSERRLRVVSVSPLTSRFSSTRPMIIIAMTTLLWWIRPYEGGQYDILTVISKSVMNALRDVDLSNVSQATLSPSFSYLEVLLSDLGFTILIMMGTIGSLLLLKGYSVEDRDLKGSANSSMITISFVALCMIPVPFIAAIVYPNSLPSRWFPVLEILCSTGAGVSVLLLISIYRKTLARTAVLLALFTVIFMLISSPVVNPNGGIYATDLAERSALTNPEYQAMTFINGLSASYVNINSKYTFLDYNQLINPDKPATFSSGLTVVRDYDINKGFTIPLFGSQGALLEIVPTNDEFNTTLSQMSQIYDIGPVKVYMG